MAIVWKCDDEGLTVVDTEMVTSVYAYPTSENWNKAKRLVSTGKTDAMQRFATRLMDKETSSRLMNFPCDHKPPHVETYDQRNFARCGVTAD